MPKMRSRRQGVEKGESGKGAGKVRGSGGKGRAHIRGKRKREEWRKVGE